jgi:hypothetical protein
MKPLTHFCADFERLVNLDSLSPHLCKEGLLTSSELEEWLRIKPGSSRSHQILHLLSILDKKGEKGILGVIGALKMEDCHAGHYELAEILTMQFHEGKL